ncbi:MAG: glycosyltransferase family 4 protein [Janthinobacterium lividum]
MRIGIDARTLSGRFTGDRTYWRGLIGGLAAIDTVNEYVLYTRGPVEGELPPGLGPNFIWREIARPASDALWMLLAFPLALKADKIDVAHTQYNIPLLGSPCPVVTTVHDVSFRVHPDLFLPKDRWILNTLVPRSMQKAAAIVAVSESTRRDILRFYKTIPKEKVHVILEAAGPQYRIPEGGQETARLTANKALELDDKPYLLAVGVLQPRKNLELLLDAFALLKLGPSPPPHRLIIAGKRGWLDDTDAQMAALPEAVTRDIVLAGYVADADLPTLYGGADALCYPSRYEGFGLPPLEAMACGCPVLCSRSSSLPEVVGDAGILLPADNSHAWAHALERLLSSPTVLARWRERGPERAAQFSWEKTARETLLVYEEITR